MLQLKVLHNITFQTFGISISLQLKLFCVLNTEVCALIELLGMENVHH
jgi:hypothetical protein